MAGGMLKGKSLLDISKAVSTESNESVENHPSTSKDDQKRSDKSQKSVKGTLHLQKPQL